MFCKELLMRNAGLLILVALMIVSGCSSPSVSTVSTRDFRQSASSKKVLQATELVPGDAIEVSVEVDGSMEVSQHRAGINHLGYITLPLVGDVKIGGLRLDQARDAIAKTYGSYYVNEPVVMVGMAGGAAEGEWGYVTVMGRVGKPGRIPLGDADGLTLTEAIQAAGGFGFSAKQSDIRISRVDKSGKKIQVSVDFEEIGQGGNAEADISLIDGDVVYVPERIF